MQKKSKVTNVQSNGTWEGSYGTMYKFEVTFDDGDQESDIEFDEIIRFQEIV